MQLNKFGKLKNIYFTFSSIDGAVLFKLAIMSKTVKPKFQTADVYFPVSTVKQNKSQN